MLGTPNDNYQHGWTHGGLGPYRGVVRPGWLTIDSDGTTARAVLHTVLHRRPRDLAVSLATAASLVATGMPVVVRRIDGAVPGNAA